MAVGSLNSMSALLIREAEYQSNTRRKWCNRVLFKGDEKLQARDKASSQKSKYDC